QQARGLGPFARGLGTAEDTEGAVVTERARLFEAHDAARGGAIGLQADQAKKQLADLRTITERLDQLVGAAAERTGETSERGVFVERDHAIGDVLLGPQPAQDVSDERQRGVGRARVVLARAALATLGVEQDLLDERLLDAHAVPRRRLADGLAQADAADRRQRIALGHAIEQAR